MAGNTVNTSSSAWQGWQNQIYSNIAQNMTTNFGGYYTPVFNSGSSASSSTSASTSTTSTDAYESATDYKKRMKEQKNRVQEQQKKIKEYQNSEVDITAITQELGITVDNAKKTKKDDGTEVITAKTVDLQRASEAQKSKLNNSRTKADGSVVINQSMTEYKKKTPWWKRTARSAVNMVQGVWKLATNFVGFEDGMSLKNWNWKKCLRNAGIALVSVAACAACPALATVFLYAGVAAGAFGIGKGVAEATKAETVEDMDKAFQDIGVGAFVGVSSAVGLRNIGRTVSHATTQTGSGFTGKISSFFNEFKPSNIKQSFTDMTVNAVKGTKIQMATLKTSINNNGFWKAEALNLKKAFVEPTQDMFKNVKNNLKGKCNNVKRSFIHTKWNTRRIYRKYSKKSGWSLDMLYKVPLKLVWGALKGTWKTGKFAVKTAFGAMGITTKPWTYVSKTPAGTEYQVEQAISSTFETCMFAQTMTKDEVKTQKEQIAQYLKQMKEEANEVYGTTDSSKVLTA